MKTVFPGLSVLLGALVAVVSVTVAKPVAFCQAAERPVEYVEGAVLLEAAARNDLSQSLVAEAASACAARPARCTDRTKRVISTLSLAWQPSSASPEAGLPDVEVSVLPSWARVSEESCREGLRERPVRAQMACTLAAVAGLQRVGVRSDPVRESLLWLSADECTSLPSGLQAICSEVGSGRFRDGLVWWAVTGLEASEGEGERVRLLLSLGRGDLHKLTIFGEISTDPELRPYVRVLHRWFARSPKSRWDAWATIEREFDVRPDVDTTLYTYGDVRVPARKTTQEQR